MIHVRIYNQSGEIVRDHTFSLMDVAANWIADKVYGLPSGFRIEIVKK